MKLNLTLSLLFLLTSLFGQRVEQHFNLLQQGKSSFLTKEQIASYTNNAAIITDLSNYLKTDNPKLQREAIRLTARIGAMHQSAAVRQQAVINLLQATNTVAAALVEKIVRGVQQFSSDDFTEVARGELASIIRNKKPHLSEFIKVAGWLEMTDLLQEVLPKYGEDDNLRTAINLALARSGEEKKLTMLMDKVEEMKVNDDFNYQIAPLLIYVRQPAAFDFLFEIIQSDEKNCRPAAADVAGNILCAYRVMEAVVPYVQDFPVEVGVSGDLKVKDYRVALKEVRTWLTEKGSDYELLRTKY